MKISNIIILVLCSNVLHAQLVPSSIANNWQEIRLLLDENKTLVTAFTDFLKDSKYLDTSLLTSANNSFKALTDSIAKFPDSLAVSTLKKKKFKNSVALGKIFAQLENDEKLRETPAFRNWQMKLEGFENRYQYSIKAYNDACVKSGRSDLIYPTD